MISLNDARSMTQKSNVCVCYYSATKIIKYNHITFIWINLSSRRISDDN